MKRFEYKWVVAVTFVLGLFMEIMDTTIVNVIIPSIIEDLATGSTEAQWIQESYAIVFAALHGPTAPVIVFHGLLFGYVRLRTGSLWPSFLMHAVNNALALTGLYITLRGG